jgi:hypothetical protein
VQKSLVAFDTDHIKEYVFGTDRLKEIRGASSLLDRLNRKEMERVAGIYRIEKEAIIYTNGGSGLFIVDGENAENFGKSIQQIYRKRSEGRASITFAAQSIPNSSENTIDDLKKRDLHHELELLMYRLVEEKGNPLPEEKEHSLSDPTSAFALSSHPFMRHCSSCGVEYAEKESENDEDDGNGDSGALYCASCAEKRTEDIWVKNRIKDAILALKGRGQIDEAYLWDRILKLLKEEGYDLSDPDVSRPNDFNEFRQFAQSKEYIGLIYADANNMGKTIEKLDTLEKRHTFAHEIDQAIHSAMSLAIHEHLPIVKIERESTQGEKRKKKQVSVFPFDILLVGGDDVVMVTDAAKAMDVALIIAQKFRELANNERISKLTSAKLSLSVGVVLAPVKYPFGLLQDMAESALKFAKKAAHDDQAKAKDPKQFDGTRINFLVVTGGSKPDFKLIYNDLYHRMDKDKKGLEFHASLRPYKTKDLQDLLGSIREGRRLRLGRTKLHQLREAVLDKNLTTSVQKGLATWHNWRSEKQRGYVTGLVYEYGARRQAARANVNDPASLFVRFTFPWFADGKNKERDVYRTPLLDFIELYDFVAREGEDNGDEA